LLQKIRNVLKDNTIMKIEKRTVTSAKGDITLYKLTNAKGYSVELSTLGAGVVSVVVPDRAGNPADVALGYANPADYIYDGPCAGKCPGRYANRIALGQFSVDGKQYQLAINNGPNALHGGPEGFQNQNWEAEELSDGIRFTYISKDGEEGYPGEVKATVSYHWTDDNELQLHFEAVTDAPTVINLTNHSYWNLKGEGKGSILDHRLRMKCSSFLPGSDSLIPTGEMQPVAGTPMDFTEWKCLGRDIRADFPAINYAKGYDSSWAIDGYEKGKFIADVVEIEEPESGRTLKIGTTQPAAHIYTGNWLDGSPVGKCGRRYRDYDGVAVEMQGMPDAPNKPMFPCQELRPGEVYTHDIHFKFGN